MRFWKWWTVACLGLIGLGFGEYQFGLSDFLLGADNTYLTFVIIAIGVLATLSMLLKWRGMPGKENSMLWFLADAVLSIGMVGTLVGFLMVLGQAFADIDTSSTESMTAAIGTLATGMSTALVTSLVGLVTSIWLKYQLVILEDGDA